MSAKIRIKSDFPEIQNLIFRVVPNSEVRLVEKVFIDYTFDNTYFWGVNKKNSLYLFGCPPNLNMSAIQEDHWSIIKRAVQAATKLGIISTSVNKKYNWYIYHHDILKDRFNTVKTLAEICEEAGVTLNMRQKNKLDKWVNEA